MGAGQGAVTLAAAQKVPWAQPACADLPVGPVTHVTNTITVCIESSPKLCPQRHIHGLP